jgi:hypothetical protein
MPLTQDRYKTRYVLEAARQSPSQKLDTETRAEALNILARIIVRAYETTQHTEAAGE